MAVAVEFASADAVGGETDLVIAACGVSPASLPAAPFKRSFDPNVINPATNAPGAMWYAVTHANGRTTLQKPVWNNWLPRVGFAYLVGDKTTIRGGFGM